MKPLSSLVQDMNRLILAGQTLTAMRQFYADDVTMQENQDAPRVGKAVCLAHEEQMLARVSELNATLHRQAIDDVNGVVFSEWTYESTSQTGKRYVLNEVSVQNWQGEQISSERFYYGKILMVA